MQIIRYSPKALSRKVLAGTPAPPFSYFNNGVTIDVSSLDTLETYQVTITKAELERFVQAVKTESTGYST